MKRRGMSFQVAAGPAEDDLSSRGGVSGWRPDLISSKWNTPARVNIMIYNSKGLLIKPCKAAVNPPAAANLSGMEQIIREKVYRLAFIL